MGNLIRKKIIIEIKYDGPNDSHQTVAVATDEYLIILF